MCCSLRTQMSTDDFRNLKLLISASLSEFFKILKWRKLLSLAYRNILCPNISQG